jgi:hypothetical protein
MVPRALRAAARRLNPVPRDVTSRRGDLFLHARRLGRGSSLLRRGRCGNSRRSRGRHLGQYLIEQRGTRAGLLLSALPVLVGMLGITGLADHFHHLPVYHAGNGMIQQVAATGAIIVNQIAETRRQFSHDYSLGGRTGTGVLREPAHYSAAQTKINRRGHDGRQGLASVKEQSPSTRPIPA